MSAEITDWTEEDEELASIDKNLKLLIESGDMAVAGKTASGQITYRVTEKGMKRVENMRLRK